MENLSLSPALAARAPSRMLVGVGRALTALVSLFLAIDAVAKLIPLAAVVEGTQKLGFDPSVIRPLGAVLATATLLHVTPRTQLVGAVLLTAYLGGATATHVLSGTPFWFPVAMGVLLWIAYALRSAQVRALLSSAR